MFYCPKCDPDHEGGYGFSIAFCQEHARKARHQNLTREIEVLACVDCKNLYMRPPMGRPPLRCRPCRTKRERAMAKARLIRWAAKADLEKRELVVEAKGSTAIPPRRVSGSFSPSHCSSDKSQVGRSRYRSDIRPRPISTSSLYV